MNLQSKQELETSKKEGLKWLAIVRNFLNGGTEKPKEIDGNDLAKQYYEAWKGTLHERKL